MKRHGWCLVVVGDKKGPFKYNVEEAETDAIDFLPHEEQEQIIRKNSSVSKFAQSIPWNHFGRKNLGYLYAVSQGATVIWDFDDDNMVTAEEFPPDLENGMKKVLWAPGPGAREGNVSALNIYHTMGCAASPCWPRGFPLSLAKSKAPPIEKWLSGDTAPSNKRLAVLQSVVDNDPDMDAMFRLTSRLPTGIHFKAPAVDALALPDYVFCSANAQATLHRADAFWALLLPMTVHGRVSDIWRSYLGQRLLWDVGLSMAFAPPLAKQVRNAHDYRADFDAELPLYKRTEALLSFLWEWKGKKETLPERMEELYEEAYARGYIEVEDLESLRLWLVALDLVGYKFPALVSSSPSQPSFPQGHEDVSDVSTKEEVSSWQWPWTTLFPNKAQTDLLNRVELFLPLWNGDVDPYHMFAETSLLMFWPTARLLLLMDDEKPLDHSAAATISQQAAAAQANAAKGLPLQNLPNVRVAFQGDAGIGGHDRQQLRMLQADLWSQAEYVGFVDSDAIFITPVMQEDMFDPAGKPFIIGEVGKPQNPGFWALVPQQTAAAMGFPEPFRCMSEFPLVVKMQHIKEMRAFLEQKFQKSIERIWKDNIVVGKPYSQFNMMCAWLYKFKASEYSFRLHEPRQGWRGDIPGQITPAEMDRMLTQDPNVKTYPLIRTARHGHYDKITDPHLVAQAMLPGYCRSLTPAALPPRCAGQATGTHESLFVFEMQSWMWNHDGVKRAEEQHYRAVASKPPVFNNYSVVKMMADLP